MTLGLMQESTQQNSRSRAELGCQVLRSGQKEKNAIRFVKQCGPG